MSFAPRCLWLCPFVLRNPRALVLPSSFSGIFLSVLLPGGVILEFPWKRTLRPRQPRAGGLLEREGCGERPAGATRGRKRRQEDALRNWPLLPATGATPPGLRQSLGKRVLKLRTRSMKEEHSYPLLEGGASVTCLLVRRVSRWHGRLSPSGQRSPRAGRRRYVMCTWAEKVGNRCENGAIQAEAAEVGVARAS